MTGTIHHVIVGEGIGVIRGVDGREYLLHQLELIDGAPFADLRVGQTVTFDAGAGPKGLRAVDVTRRAATRPAVRGLENAGPTLPPPLPAIAEL